MITIDVRFNEKGKIYKYLLINPNNFKINKEKPLTYITGVTATGVKLQSYMDLIKVQRVDVLPSIVTSQILLLDENNNILVQRLGRISTEKETKSEISESPKNASIILSFNSIIKQASKKHKDHKRIETIIKASTNKTLNKWSKMYRRSIV